MVYSVGIEGTLVSASLAQSAARQSHNLKVVSSSLTGGTFSFHSSPESVVFYLFTAQADLEKDGVICKEFWQVAVPESSDEHQILLNLRVLSLQLACHHQHLHMYIYAGIHT